MKLGRILLSQAGPAIDFVVLAVAAANLIAGQIGFIEVTFGYIIADVLWRALIINLLHWFCGRPFEIGIGFVLIGWKAQFEVAK